MRQTDWITRFRSIAEGLFVFFVFLPSMHRLWWNSHPGSEKQFIWYLMGAVMLYVPVFVLYKLGREYWPIFFNSSQEEHNGIQR